MGGDPRTDESLPVPLPKEQWVWEGMGPGLWGVREPMLSSGLSPSVGQGCRGLVLGSCSTQMSGLLCTNVGSLVVWGGPWMLGFAAVSQLSQTCAGCPWPLPHPYTIICSQGAQCQWGTPRIVGTVRGSSPTPRSANRGTHCCGSEV